jgi:SNF2 family DNA or RNA helicase
VEFTPRIYQHYMNSHTLERNRSAVWAGMGMGKTSGTLYSLQCLELVEPGPALVLAPRRVATSTWPDEVTKWETFKSFEVSTIVGDAKQRAKALKKDANLFTINYENLPWLIEHLDGEWPWKKVVADESTRLKGFRLRQGSTRARALGRVAHSRINHFIELTGTPSPNGLLDLWGQMWFIDRGRRLGTSFSAYRERYFTSVQVGADPHALSYKALPYAQEQIQDLIKDVALSLDAADYFDIQKPIVSNIEVELPAKAFALYREMEKHMFAEIGEHGVEAFNAGSKTMKCLQLANGAIYTDDKNTQWHETHDAKLQALESIVEEAGGMPILVGYHFRHDLARILKAFPKARELDDNPETIRKWNRGEIPMLVAHPESCGHGLNLQDGGNIVVFVGHWWSLEPYLQIIERIGPTRQAQSGHNRPVFVYHIIARNTVDGLVMSNRDGKKSVQQILMDAMKRRPS